VKLGTWPTGGQGGLICTSRAVKMQRHTGSTSLISGHPQPR
jgi:hypothetical protein